jgi:hypothetical protein
MSGNERFRALPARPVDADAPIHWGCSGRGWNCCTDKAIAVRPYDMVRLRHALRRSSQDLVNDGTVTFHWEPDGSMLGRLPRVPYESNRTACAFYEEVTNLRAREIRDQDPGRFASLPEPVRRAADSHGRGEWRVAGLCGIHRHRPEACRGFPFQRDPLATDGGAVKQIFRCGSCALSRETTPREVLEENEIAPFWRADDAYRQVARYLHARGAARDASAGYRTLPLDDTARAELWAAMYVPDGHPEVAERFPQQWLADDDPAGDLEILRLAMEQTLQRIDALVVAAGAAPDDLGSTRARAERPDLGRLLDPTRPLTLDFARNAA